MAETTSLVINVKSDQVGKATKSLKKLGLTAKTTATQTGRFGKTAGLASGGIKKATVATAGMATATRSLLLPLAAILAPLAGFRKLLNAGVEIGKWRAQLKTATGSVEEAAAAFETLEIFATKTPFALDQTIATFLKMKNLGLDPTNESMTALGNLASGLGKDFEETSAAVAKAAIGNGESLRDMGFRFNKVGDEITLGFRDTTISVENDAAKITAAIVSIAEEQFAGAMADEMDTVGGKLSNLGDAWDTLWRTIAESGVDDMMGDAFSTIADSLSELTKRFKNGEIAAYVQGWVGVLENFGAVGKTVFGQLDDLLRPGKAEDDAESWIMHYSELWAKWFTFMGTGLATVAQGLSSMFELSAMATAKATDLLPQQMKHQGKTAGNTFKRILRGVVPGDSPLGGLLGGEEETKKEAEELAALGRGITNQAEAYDKAYEGLKTHGLERLDKIVERHDGTMEKWQSSFKKVKELEAELAAPVPPPLPKSVLDAISPDTPTDGPMHGPDNQTKEELELEKLQEKLNKKQAIQDAAAARKAEAFKASEEKKDKDDLERKAKHEKRMRALELDSAASLADSLGQLAAHFGEKGAKAQKALRITSATIDMYAGATAALADPEITSTAAKYMMAGSVIASGMANIASITSAGSYANGGIIPGNSPSGDRLQANVNSGEMILNQKQQANLFKQVNNGGGGGGSVTINNYGNDNVETKKDGNGNMEIIIRQAADLAKSELADEINTGDGDFAPMMQNTFGLSRGMS